MRLEFLIQYPDFSFNLFSVSDVANNADDKCSRSGGQWTEADFHRKLASIGLQRIEFQAHAHAAHVRIAKEIFTVLQVVFPVALRDQRIDGHAQKLVARITKKGFDLRVGNDNFAGVIDHQDGVGNSIQKRAEITLHPIGQINSIHLQAAGACGTNVQLINVLLKLCNKTRATCNDKMVGSEYNRTAFSQMLQSFYPEWMLLSINTQLLTHN